MFQVFLHGRVNKFINGHSLITHTVNVFVLLSSILLLPQKHKRRQILIIFCPFCVSAECQALLLLRQPSEGPGGSKLAFGNEPGSAVGGQQQQAESGAGGSGGAR